MVFSWLVQGSGGTGPSRVMVASTLRDDAIAARAVEREGVFQREIHVARQALAQLGAGPEEARAHRGFGNLERGGDFLDRHLLHRAQHEHRAEHLGQLVDARFHQAAHLGAAGRQVRLLVVVGFHAAPPVGRSPTGAPESNITTFEARRRTRFSASFSTMRTSQVDSFASLAESCPGARQAFR